MDELDGKLAVITGGASGIGLETAARQLAASGTRLVLADIPFGPFATTLLTELEYL